jgi:hypothetical protein
MLQVCTKHLRQQHQCSLAELLDLQHLARLDGAADLPPQDKLFPYDLASVLPLSDSDIMRLRARTGMADDLDWYEGGRLYCNLHLSLPHQLPAVVLCKALCWFGRMNGCPIGHAHGITLCWPAAYHSMINKHAAGFHPRWLPCSCRYVPQLQAEDVRRTSLPCS